MPTLGDSLSRAIGGRARVHAADASAPKPGIARRLSARGRGRGVGAVISAAALVSAGAWWQGADGTISPHPDPSPSVGETATVTMPLDGVDWSPSTFQPPFGCGDEVPTPNLSERGFTLEVTTSTTGGATASAPTVTTSMTYQGEGMEDAAIGAFDTFIVKDGIIVGYLWAYENEYTGPVVGVAPVDRFEGNRYTPGNWNTVSLSPCLEGTFDQDTVLLAAGEYDLVVAEWVRHSAESLALIDLERSDYVLGNSLWGSWEPGSIDCEQAIRDDIEYGGGGVPVQCDPVGARGAGAVVDADAGTVTLDYEVRPGPLDLDLLLVSEPVHWVVPEDVTPAELGWTTGDETPVEIDDLACDSVPTSWGWESIEGWSATATTEELAAAGEIPVALDTAYVSQAQQGTVTIGAATDAWVIAYNGGGIELVGTASAAFSPSGALALDRAKDYVRTSLKLTDYQACPGRESNEASEANWLTVVVRAPVVIDGDGAERATVDYVSIRLGDDR